VHHAAAVKQTGDFADQLCRQCRTGPAAPTLGCILFPEDFEPSVEVLREYRGVLKLQLGLVS
jgi:hypothetical protein